MDELNDALAWCERKAASEGEKFLNDFRRDTATWNLQHDDEKFLRLLTAGRISGRAILSNAHVHHAAQKALFEALPREFEEHPERHWLWVTLACDIGLTWEDRPIIDTIALRNTFNAHIRRCGLEGFGVLETDIWKNIKGEPGRRIVPHVHFVGWANDDRNLDVRGLERNLCGRRALKNSLLARSADVQQINRASADFARIGRYMLKRPAYAKNPIPRLDGTYDLKDVNHARGSVARLVEIQSRMEVGDIIFSIGAGKPIANAVRQAVAHEVRSRPGAEPAPSWDAVVERWRRIRLLNGDRRLEECVVITRKDQRRLFAL